MEKLISKLEETLKKINVRSLLVNGNVEKQLKFLLASIHDAGENWYLMDKKFSKHEVDLVLFEANLVKLVAELKCTFAWDAKRLDKDVADAIVKAERTRFLAINQSDESWMNIRKNAKQYIVHFLLLSDPRSSEKPEWVNKKYKVPQGYSISNAVKSVKEKYLKNISEVEVDIEIITISPNVLDVILVRVA